MRFLIVFVTAAFLVGCNSAAPRTAPPPWQQPALEEVPAVYRTAWNAAENRSSCALLAFDGPLPDATARQATFSGGWAVAYDTPSRRSAFGIAGTGADVSGTTHQWPDEIIWSDGSRATWGLEGGTGPNHLAYVTVAGQDCLYNVWSALGEEHLERLLEQIRFVRTGA